MDYIEYMQSVWEEKERMSNKGIKRGSRKEKDD